MIPRQTITPAAGIFPGSGPNLNELAAKLNEFDDICHQYSTSTRVLFPLFTALNEIIPRLQNRARNGKAVPLQLEQLRKIYEQFPDALDAISAEAKSLKSIAKEALEIIDGLPKS